MVRVLIQRVSKANVKIEDKTVGTINKGYLLLVGFSKSDDKIAVDKVINKIINLRIFEDASNKMNLCIKDIGGSILSISQFTLYADYTSGKRPGFQDALKYEDAIKMYNYFNASLLNTGVNVEKGVFGAKMQVELINDGPVTIMIDSDFLKK
ncbi:MAG: D-aminoacyl-tRNA deacylase [Bacilli bacterium]|nr:D-aminoacyl-tRNA deacylase [Bacilli bacterium]